MAATPSSMVSLGTPAPDFALASTDGRVVRLADFAPSRALVVMFICNHCPFVKHLHAALAEFGRDMQARGAAIVAINSNDADKYPADSFEAMIAEKKNVGYTFPYLFDPTQEVARAYRAACTPDFFAYSADRRLAYRGQFDASRPGNAHPVTGADLRAAVEALLENRPAPADQKPSIGCNIKWRE